MFNAHRIHSYTRDAFSKIASNWIVVKPGTPLKKNWEFLDIAGPGEWIYWISMTDRAYEPDNQTNKKIEVLYYPINEDDTYLLEMDDLIATISLVNKYASINALWQLDSITVNDVIWQVEVISVISENIVEVSLVKKPLSEPIVKLTWIVPWVTLENWQSDISNISVPWATWWDIVNIYPSTPIDALVNITAFIAEDNIVRVTIENQSGETQNIWDVNILVLKL